MREKGSTYFLFLHYFLVPIFGFMNDYIPALATMGQQWLRSFSSSGCGST